MSDTPVATHSGRLPGVEGLWVFVGFDMTFFSALFMAFMLGRGEATALYEVGRQTLSADFGGINTLILLTSSWFVVMAVDAARRERHGQVSSWLLAALLCGVAFGVSKVIEYAAKIGAGLTPATNDFYMYYFLLTGLHLLHVLGGSVLLLVLWSMARKEAFSGKRLLVLESGGIVWHMIDLLWIILFPLLYLTR